MNISRDVVKDLIPVYLAVEASADTQALVESYLKTDPELAGDVTAARGTSLELPATRPPTAKKQTLDATRQLLQSRTSTLGSRLSSPGAAALRSPSTGRRSHSSIFVTRQSSESRGG